MKLTDKQAIKRIITNGNDDKQAIRHIQTYGKLIKDNIGEISRYQIYSLVGKYIEIEMTLGEYTHVSVWHSKPDHI
jgi:hypothetical protein